MKYKSLSYSTLMRMTKKDLIEYIRCLEHNWKVAMEFNEQQSKNFTDFLDTLEFIYKKGGYI